MGGEESAVLGKGALLLLLVASELTRKRGDLRVVNEKLGGLRVEKRGGRGRVGFNGEHLCTVEEETGATGVWLDRYIFIGQAVSQVF